MALQSPLALRERLLALPQRLASVGEQLAHAHELALHGAQIDRRERVGRVRPRRCRVSVSVSAPARSAPLRRLGASALSGRAV